VGTTRADPTDGGSVVALEYEAYRAMAERQLIDLARRARERWDIKRLVLVHRVGRVEVGQPSVLIVVACPHRAQAFDACRWLIDTLKTDVAIWKRDVLSDGSTRWVDPS
jgi:molybdopterin synthase catalytic subunit